MEIYIIEVIVFQAVFFIVYELFLKRETFFNANRVYLLLTPIVSLILPFLQIEAFQTSMPETFVTLLPAVVIGGSTESAVALEATSSTFPVLEVLWTLGVIIALGLFIKKLRQLFLLKSSGQKKNHNGVGLISIPNSEVAFSFCNWIFLGDAIMADKRTRILDHECTHVKNYHSIDLLFFEFLKIIMWFNPFIYLFQKRISALHEFVADAEVTSNTPQKHYYQELLSEVFQTKNLSFTNTFFNQSLIKKRISMLHKTKSKSILKLKYLAIIPLIAGMLFYVSCSDDNTTEDTQETSQSEQLRFENLMSKFKGKSITEAEKEELMETMIQMSYYWRQNEQTLEGKLPSEKSDAYFSREDKTPIKREDVYGSVQIERTDGVEITDVPFEIIENVPIFPGCTGGTNAERKACMSEKVDGFVKSRFDATLGKKLGLDGIQRIYVAFKIDKSGNVIDVRARAPHPDLKEEAERIIKELPQMEEPGKQKGEPVGVLYSLPITFKVLE